jgi:hypothetical protein
MEVLELNKKAKPINKWLQYVPESVIDYCIEIDMVGSYYILEDKTKAKDIDILCLVIPEKRISFLQTLIFDENWKDAPGYAAINNFTSLRKDKVNILMTKHREWFDKFIAARDVCKLLKVEDKNARIAVHDLIMKAPKKINMW